MTSRGVQIYIKMEHRTCTLINHRPISLTFVTKSVWKFSSHKKTDQSKETYLNASKFVFFFLYELETRFQRFLHNCICWDFHANQRLSCNVLSFAPDFYDLFFLPRLLLLLVVLAFEKRQLLQINTNANKTQITKTTTAAAARKTAFITLAHWYHVEL